LYGVVLIKWYCLRGLARANPPCTVATAFSSFSGPLQHTSTGGGTDRKALLSRVAADCTSDVGLKLHAVQGYSPTGTYRGSINLSSSAAEGTSWISASGVRDRMLGLRRRFNLPGLCIWCGGHTALARPLAACRMVSAGWFLPVQASTWDCKRFLPIRHARSAVRSFAVRRGPLTS